MLARVMFSYYRMELFFLNYSTHLIGGSFTVHKHPMVNGMLNVQKVNSSFASVMIFHSSSGNIALPFMLNACRNTYNVFVFEFLLSMGRRLYLENV